MENGLAEKLKRVGVIRRESDRLKGSHLSDYYVDIKLAYGRPDILSDICDALWERMDKSTTCVAGSGYGGVTPAAIISTRHGLRLTMIKDKSQYFSDDRMEGHIPVKGDKVSIVDGIFTRNMNSTDRVEIIKSRGAEILGYYVVVKRDEPNIGVQFYYLFLPRDLF